MSDSSPRAKKKCEIITINGEITDDTYSDFCRKMSELEESKRVKTVRVIINTDGGSYYDGLAIASRIMSSRLKVVCEVYGRAFSAGSMIAVAGSKTYMSRHAKIMVHELITGVYGNTTQVVKLALQLLQEQQEYCEFMASKTPVEAPQWDAWLREETYFTATQALDYGIIDGILEEM